MASVIDDAARGESLAGEHHQAAKLWELVAVRRQPSAVDLALLGNAYAEVGAAEPARHMLRRSDDADGAGTDGPLGAIGGAWLALGDPDRALQAWTASAEMRPAGRARATDTANISRAYLRAGQTADGAAAAERAFALAEPIGSAALAAVLDQMRDDLRGFGDSTCHDLVDTFA